MKKVRELDEETGVTKEVTEIGVPTILPIPKWAIQEEINDLDSYREHLRDIQSQLE